MSSEVRDRACVGHGFKRGGVKGIFELAGISPQLNHKLAPNQASSLLFLDSSNYPNHEPARTNEPARRMGVLFCFFGSWFISCPSLVRRFTVIPRQSLASSGHWEPNRAVLCCTVLRLGILALLSHGCSHSLPSSAFHSADLAGKKNITFEMLSLGFWGGEWKEM